MRVLTNPPHQRRLRNHYEKENAIRQQAPSPETASKIFFVSGAGLHAARGEKKSPGQCPGLR